jgi:hypothetical protein
MKKLFLILMIAVLGVFISSCDSENDPITPAETGDVFVTSTPSGAQIWIDGTNSGKVTPDTIFNLDVGTYEFVLKLNEYLDATFNVTVVANQTATPNNVTLSTALVLSRYNSVRIWETLAVGANQPSGLDLSIGTALSVAGADKQDVDIYYTSSGFLVQSAHLNTTQGLTRETKFFVGSSTDIDDGVNSPLQNSGTWTTNVADTETDYFFLYDADGHYSKARITGRGTTPDAWVEITYWYNNAVDDERF